MQIATTTHAPRSRHAQPDTAKAGDGAPGRLLELDRAELMALVADSFAHGRDVWIRVRGASMAPVIPPGSSVRIQRIHPGSLVPGAIVFARSSGGAPVVHRVVSAGDQGVVLRGDNRQESDGLIARDQVLGVVIAIASEGRIRVPSRRRPGALAFVWYRMRLRAANALRRLRGFFN